MTHVAEREDLYLGEFERIDKTRRDQPAWLGKLRRDAIGRFVKLGFPTARLEEWKFTSVTPIAEAQFRLVDGDRGGRPVVSRDDVHRFSAGLGGRLIVTVNGRYIPDLSAPGAAATGDVRVSSLRSWLASDAGALEPYLGNLASYNEHAFTALNTAFADDGVCVFIAPNAVVSEPIELLFVSRTDGQRTVSHPRVLIVAGENSQARIVETFAGSPGEIYFTNAVTEVAVGPNAVVDHYKLQRESHDGFHIGTMHVGGARSANFVSHSLSLGGALVRNEVMAVLDGEGIDFTLNGLYLADGHRFVDNHTTIDHAKPHCGSHEIYKGILSGHARAVFNGKIIVRPDAQKTDAKQTNKALLLTDEAQINTKPQLEIFANDVKCTHGAAVGQLDEDAIFYLRARGLSLTNARAMLIHAFAGDILNRVRLEPLRAQLEETLLAQLSNRS